MYRQRTLPKAGKSKQICPSHHASWQAGPNMAKQRCLCYNRACLEAPMKICPGKRHLCRVLTDLLLLLLSGLLVTFNSVEEYNCLAWRYRTGSEQTIQSCLTQAQASQPAISWNRAEGGGGRGGGTEEIVPERSAPGQPPSRKGWAASTRGPMRASRYGTGSSRHFHTTCPQSTPHPKITLRR